MPTCKNPEDLRFGLEKYGIEIGYKYKRTTNEIENVSFRYGYVAFKGSEVDREFSFGNLKKKFQKNTAGKIKRAKEKYLWEQVERETRLEAELKVKLEAEERDRKETEVKTQAVKRNIVLKGMELSNEQQKTLTSRGLYLP